MKKKKNRQAKRKQKIKLGFGWVKPLLAVATVAGSAIGLTLLLDWMQDPQRWPVAQVGIKGEFRHLQASQLQAEIEPLAATGFFVMDVSEIQTRLQQLAWVDQVSVRRVWPDRLDIQVREQQAVAYWDEDSYMNARAEIFTPEVAVEMEGLPRLSGPEGHQRRVLTMHHDMQQLVQPLQLDVVRLDLDARRTWRVELSNGLVVEAGRTHPVERLARFVRVYPAILASGRGQLTSVDLRYSHGFAVHWNTERETDRGAG